LQRGVLKEATEAGRQGMDAARVLHRRQVLRDHSASFLRTLNDLPAILAMAHGKLDDASEAVLVLESSRALLISEALERGRADLAQLDAQGRGDLLYHYRMLSEQLATLQAAPEVQAPETVRELWESLDAAVEQIRQVPGFEDFLGEPDLDDVYGVPDTPLVYLVSTPVGGAAYVVGGTERSSVQTVDLPKMSSDVVRDWLIRYFTAYDARDTDPYAWEQTLDAVTGELWFADMGKIVRALSTVNRAVLIPVGSLGLLPLHAAWSGTRRRRRYAMDEVGFTYAPNARLLKVALNRAAAAGADRLLLVGSPGTGRHELTHVDEEITAVATHFASAQRADDRQSVLNALPDTTVLHVASHGWADLTDPLDSALDLTDGQSLTLRDILQAQAGGLRLAVLSACETGVVSANTPNETVGFPAGACSNVGFMR
jgi:hypothetical protein